MRLAPRSKDATPSSLLASPRLQSAGYCAATVGRSRCDPACILTAIGSPRPSWWHSRRIGLRGAAGLHDPAGFQGTVERPHSFLRPSGCAAADLGSRRSRGNVRECWRRPTQQPVGRRFPTFDAGICADRALQAVGESAMVVFRRIVGFCGPPGKPWRCGQPVGRLSGRSSPRSFLAYGAAFDPPSSEGPTGATGCPPRSSWSRDRSRFATRCAELVQSASRG